MPAHDEGQIRAQAALKRFELLERQRLEVVYDWYGLTCPCNLPPGDCEIHPRARIKQRPPGTPGSLWPPGTTWDIFLMQAGRAGGKTRASSEFCRWKVERGEWRNFLIVGATYAEVLKYQIEGPSGLVTISPPWNRARFNPARGTVTWPDGAAAYVATSEEPDSLRGGNMDGAWSDEVGKWKYQQKMWDQIGWVLRNKTDPSPQNLVSTTSTASPVMDQLNKDADEEDENPGSTRVIRVEWDTLENAKHISDRWLQRQQAMYRGTLTGEVELSGKHLRRKAGALWSPEDFEREGFRFEDIPLEDIEYLGVAIDPGAGSEDEKHASEAGIVVGARLAGKPGQWVSQAVILDDRTTTGKPGDWGAAVVRAYHDWGANEIIAEKNQGGEMVRHVIQSVPAQTGYPSGKNVPIKLVYASVGKTARSEPVQALYQAKRVRHRKGYVSALEQQMVQYVPGKHGQKLDRVDALVWFLTEALLEHDSGGECGPIVFGGSRARLVYQGVPRPWEETD